MAEKDTGEPDEKSLELPSLFGRKKRGKAAPEPEAPTPAPSADESTAESATESPVGSSAAPAPSSATDDTAVVEPITEPVVEPAREPAPAAEPVAEPTQQLPPVAPAPTPEPAPATPSATPSATAPAAARARVEDEPAYDAAPEGGARKAPKRAAKPRREAPSLPTLRGSVAAIVVGALVGLLGVGLTFGALQACDAVTGTDSCGGPGLLVVLVVVVVMIMAGSALLRAFGVVEPGGLSFLGVAIFVAICLVFLLEQLLEPWMVVVGPALCVLSFATAHWVVNRFNTELLAEESPEPHDVR